MNSSSASYQFNFLLHQTNVALKNQQHSVTGRAVNHSARRTTSHRTFCSHICQTLLSLFLSHLSCASVRIYKTRRQAATSVPFNNRYALQYVSLYY